MKKGAFTWFGYVLPLAQQLEAIAKAGFDAAMLWWGDSLADYYGTPEQRARMVERSGLTVDSVHLPYEQVNALWQKDNGALVETYLGWIGECARFGYPRVVMHATDGDTPPPLSRDGLEAFARIAAEGQRLGVEIAVENTRFPQLLLGAMGAPGCETLKFCLDTSHGHLRGDTGLLMETLGDRLICLHLSDNDGQEDRHWLPGNGQIDWGQTARLLAGAGYEGCLSLEVVPREDEKKLGPEAFMQKAYRRLAAFEELVLAGRAD